MSIQYSFVIPTNRSFEQLRFLLWSISRQTISPEHIIIVYDHHCTLEEFDIYKRLITETISLSCLIINPHSDENFFVGRGASYVRNYGRSKVSTPFMVFVDDDNTFDDDFVSKAFEYIENSSIMKNIPKGKRLIEWENNNSDHVLIVPIQYDDTTTFIRPAVADSFNFALCRPKWVTAKLIETVDRYYPLSLASSNCLIWSTILFEQFPFNEKISFVYEDLIMTWRMSQSWVRIFCDTRVSVIHAHGQRSRLAQLYINTPLSAYHKAKHRIILVRTIGTIGDKILFYLIGLPGQTAWLIFHILWYAPIKHRFGLISALVKGTKDGIKEIH